MCKVTVKVVQRRGGAFEAEHAFDAMLCDAEGRVLHQVGENLVTTFRSSAKPFQLATCLELLGARVEGLDERLVAIGAASHHGEPDHVQHVVKLLAHFGRPSDEPLFCGAHPPFHAESAAAVWASGARPSVLHNNCSGKHTFMAAATAAAGWESDYRPLQHPLQQRILAQLQPRTGGTVRDGVTDGCGVPSWVLPLGGMARAWASLCQSATREPGSPLGRVAWAMQRNPWFTSGSEAFDGFLGSHANEPVVAKIGADGLLCIGLIERGLGLALKMRSGANLPRAVAAMACLQRWVPGVVTTTLPGRFHELRNVEGDLVGELRVEGPWS